MSNRARGIAKKSELRTWVVDQVLDALSSDHIFKTLDYRRKTEAYLKQYMHQPLQQRMAKIVERVQPGLKPTTKALKAREALLWEGDVNTTVNNVRFLGVQHRPDFVVKLAGISIAVEVKRGDRGASVREGIGQSLVYSASEDFDFVAFLFIDISKDHKIHDSVSRDTEQAFIDALWAHHNVRFSVV